MGGRTWWMFQDVLVCRVGKWILYQCCFVVSHGCSWNPDIWTCLGLRLRYTFSRRSRAGKSWNWLRVRTTTFSMFSTSWCLKLIGLMMIPCFSMRFNMFQPHFVGTADPTWESQRGPGSYLWPSANHGGSSRPVATGPENTWFFLPRNGEICCKTWGFNSFLKHFLTISVYF